MFDIKKKSTIPQALLIMSFLMCLMILAFMMEMLTLAPQYSTFGTQMFYPNSNQGQVPCSLSMISGAQENECVMSNISKFYNRISITLPFFSTILYAANWLLVVVIACTTFYSAFIKQETALDDLDENDDDEEKRLFANEF